MESRKRGISYSTMKRRKANRIGHIVCRNCLIRQVIGGKKTRNDRSEGKTRKKT